MTRNPNWTRDELILALDLYFRADCVQLGATNTAVVQLSQLLVQRLQDLPRLRMGPVGCALQVADKNRP
jgi:hypothetical protein